MASNWIPVKKRLPTEDDIKRNSGQDSFLVTAIYGDKGILHKTVFVSNFNIKLGIWESCSDEIVTHWEYMPSPAIVELETLEGVSN